MNRAGAWNGHVPVTAINSAILLCASILYGFRYIVFSNERSADEATLVTDDGSEVNHQYSKSSDFEAGFRAVIASQVSPDIEYFSFSGHALNWNRPAFQPDEEFPPRVFELQPELSPGWAPDRRPLVPGLPQVPVCGTQPGAVHDPGRGRCDPGRRPAERSGPGGRVSGHCAGWVGTNRSNASVRPGKAGPPWPRWENGVMA